MRRQIHLSLSLSRLGFLTFQKPGEQPATPARRSTRGTSWSPILGASDLTHQWYCGQKATIANQTLDCLYQVDRVKEERDLDQHC